MRMSPTGRPEKNRAAGFTLFEFAVVLFLISLFFVLVTVPIEGVLSGGDLGQATRLLMSEVSKLRGEAAYTRKIQTLVLDMEQNTFYALTPETLVEFRKTEESLFKEEEEIPPLKKDLPSGVFFADVVLDTLGKLQEAIASDLLLNSTVKNPAKLRDRALLWLHEQEIIRLNKGLAVFRPAIEGGARSPPRATRRPCRSTCRSWRAAPCS